MNRKVVIINNHYHQGTRRRQQNSEVRNLPMRRPEPQTVYVPRVERITQPCELQHTTATTKVLAGVGAGLLALIIISALSRRSE